MKNKGLESAAAFANIQLVSHLWFSVLQAEASAFLITLCIVKTLIIFFPSSSKWNWSGF